MSDDPMKKLDPKSGPGMLISSSPTESNMGVPNLSMFPTSSSAEMSSTKHRINSPGRRKKLQAIMLGGLAVGFLVAIGLTATTFFSGHKTLAPGLKAQLDQAEQSLTRGDFAAAIATASQALAGAPVAAEAIITRAHCAQGDLPNASDHFRKVTGESRTMVAAQCKKLGLDLRD